MRRKKKNFWKPVTAGFGAVYLLTMALATFLVKTKFTEDFAQRLREFAVYIVRQVNEKEGQAEEEGWDSEEDRQAFYQDLANGYLWRINDEMLQISLGFYGTDEALIARTRDEIGGNAIHSADSFVRRYASFDLDDYLSSQEKEQLARYQWENVHYISIESAIPDKYRFSIRTSPDGRRLWGIYVQKLIWMPEDEWDGENYADPLTGAVNSMEMVKVDYATGEETVTGSFTQTGSEIVWQWVDSNVSREELEKGTVLNTSLGLPYMTSYETWRDFESWKTWCSSQYLHGFPARQSFTWEEGIEEPSIIIDSDGFYYRGRYQLKVGTQEAPVYAELRMESSPWMAAMDYMKYVYAAGLVLTLACAAKIIRVFRKTYDAQTALEEMRRDFINAMAHELKTPLGVIRNFAENLVEHNMEEKRDYYLAQIIGQTEEMDRLIVKMIEISKLDSDEAVLKKETVSFSELAKEQMARFEPMIREKNIQVIFQDQEDFAVDGDREYLAGALWNLLSNSVNYNVCGGRIVIRTKRDCCVVENTGEPMSREGLTHAFDMFYMGDKSRNKGQGHMGMGLFLARKILGLHGLSVALENTSDGVSARIQKIDKKGKSSDIG